MGARITIAQDRVYESDKDVSVGNPGTDGWVGHCPQVCLVSECLAALTEHHHVGQHSIEALVDGRDSGCDQFHLGSV